MRLVIKADSLQHTHLQAREERCKGVDDANTWTRLGCITLAATAIDFAAITIMTQLSGFGSPLTARLVLPLALVGLACEAILLACAALFAVWGSAALEVKQLALLAFSFLSTVAIAAWRSHEAIRRLRSPGRASPHSSALRIAPESLAAYAGSVIQPLSVLRHQMTRSEASSSSLAEPTAH